MLGSEGGYSNHPNDTGGATSHGVTQGTYNGYRLRLGQLPRSVRQITQWEVSQIYLNYWFASGAYAYRVHNPMYALTLFDMAINSGVGEAKKKHRLALGDWRRFNSNRHRFYHAIVQKRRCQRVFLNGWMNRLARINRICEQMERNA